ncbi:MAG: hypothetical protein MJZ74_02775 [Muribaculaceae bacterium]|nr:hypothetical protein [Muribaculaceae bacterium]
MYLVLGAKLRTSPRLLAWRFNTLQVYDLPGISDACYAQLSVSFAHAKIRHI